MPVHADEVNDQLLKQDVAVMTLPRECCHLSAGNCFSGQQRSGRNSYEVTVEIQVLLVKLISLE